MLAAVCWSDAACSSVRCDRSWLPCAISPAATEIDSADVLMPDTIAVSFSRIASSDAIRLLRSPAATCTRTVRLLSAICAAISCAARGSPPNCRRMLREMSAAVATPSRNAIAAMTEISGADRRVSREGAELRFLVLLYLRRARVPSRGQAMLAAAAARFAAAPASRARRSATVRDPSPCATAASPRLRPA